MQNIIVLSPGEGKTVMIGPVRTKFMIRNEDTGGQFSLVEHALPPQFSRPPHVHRQCDHAFYVLEGQVRIDVGERTVQASVGTLVFVPKGLVHSFSNPGAVWSRMLQIDAPGGFEKFYEDLAEAFPEGTSIVASVLEAIQQKYDTYRPAS